MSENGLRNVAWQNTCYQLHAKTVLIYYYIYYKNDVGRKIPYKESSTDKLHSAICHSIPHAIHWIQISCLMRQLTAKDVSNLCKKLWQ